MDVHLLDGEAWPHDGSAAVFWIGPLFFGGFLALGFVVGIVDIVHRTWKRLRAPHVVGEPTVASQRRRGKSPPQR